MPSVTNCIKLVAPLNFIYRRHGNKIKTLWDRLHNSPSPEEDSAKNSISDGGNGDLIVYFEEKPHKLFSRHNDNILLDCTIEFPLEILGGHEHALSRLLL